MRVSYCSKCARRILEDDSNPNIHYSNSQTVCDRCIRKEEAPVGTWFQDSKGNYYQKQ